VLLLHALLASVVAIGIAGYSIPGTSLAATRSGGPGVVAASGSVLPLGDAWASRSPATGLLVSASSVGPGSGGPGQVSIDTLTPSSGTAGGGSTIEISGSGFTGATAVDFGRNASSDFTVTSDTTIAAVAPVGAGVVTIQVVTPSATSSSSSADRFTYVPTGQLPITAQGQSLDIGRVATQFTGFNAYQLATQVGINAGCGSMASTAQIDSFFGSLRPNSVVRFWAFQGALATNVSTGQIDWEPLDNIFYQAATFHVYLIPVISDQAGTCDGNHWQDAAWYAGGFRSVYDSATSTEGNGLTPLSYWAYMSDLVSRYADSPALGMWEPMSEAEASSCPAPYQGSDCYGHQTCPNEKTAESALKYFFTTVGAQIRLLDPTHLIEAGLLGAGECGAAGKDYRSVGASPGIDVLSVHDYYGSAPLGGDQRNGMAVRFAQAKALNKPIITGEVGIKAGIGQSGCLSLQQRALAMSAKMAAQFAAGDSAFLVWDWLTDPLGPCSFNSGPSDSSLLGALTSAQADRLPKSSALLRRSRAGT
jgi:mannan endo-1,4-beta-mannosidase